MHIAEKTAIVFGGARGIGKACTLALLQNGAKVCVADILEKEGQGTADELNNLFPNKAKFVKCDVTKLDEIDNVFAISSTIFGAIQICINSTGIVNEDNIPLMLDINFGGCVRITQCAKKYLTGGDVGMVLIHLSSYFGLTKLSWGPGYSATKHAVVGYVRSLAADRKLNGLDGMRLNVICPAAVDTPINTPEVSTYKLRDKTLRKMMAGVRKHNKMMQPTQVADGMLHLIKDDSLNGECMVVHHGGNFLDEAATDRFYASML